MAFLTPGSFSFFLFQASQNQEDFVARKNKAAGTKSLEGEAEMSFAQRMIAASSEIGNLSMKSRTHDALLQAVVSDNPMETFDHLFIRNQEYIFQ